jgi:hypothetical protein
MLCHQVNSMMKEWKHGLHTFHLLLCSAAYGGIFLGQRYNQLQHTHVLPCGTDCLCGLLPRATFILRWV